MDNDDINPASAGAFIKRGMEEDFITLAKEAKESNGKDFFVAHVCIMDLAYHYIMCDESLKMNPKQAWEKTLKRYPIINETMVKTLVSQFSIRGKEFKDWAENPERWETLWELEK